MRKTFRCKDDHPIFKKLNELYDLADKLGISFEFYDRGCYVTDKESKMTYMMKDVESDTAVLDLPPSLEYKVVYEKDV